jgi:hypothetical protein
MPSQLADFLAVVFASGAIIEVWNKGSIFATTRAKLQAIQDVTEPETLKGRVLELLGCPFCQSYHVPFWLLVVLLASPLGGATIDAIVRLVVYGLAATRLVNLLDQFLPPHMRHKPPQGSALGHTTN